MKLPFQSEAWAEARALIWPRRGRLLLGLVLILINRSMGLVVPSTSKYLVDDVLGQRQVDLILPLALAAGGATIVQALTSFSLTQVLGVAAQRVIAEMRRAIQRHVLNQPIRFFDDTQTGALVSRIMADTEAVQNLIGVGLVTLTGNALSAVMGLAVLFYLNWQLTIVTLAVLAVFSAGIGYTFRRLRPLFRERGRLQAEATGLLAERLGGIRIVKSYAAEQREHRAFTRAIHRLLRNRARSMTGTSAANALSTVTVGILAVVMIVGGGHDVLAGRMTVGELLTYVFFVALVGSPLVQVASVGTQIVDAIASLDRISDVRRSRVEELPGDRPVSIGTVRGDVVFDRVCFEYRAGEPVLENISFHAAEGSTTAVVGPSGSGKSTLMSLLMGFNRATSGTVLVDGHDLALVSLASFRTQLGVVLQESFLFDGTIAENIRYSRPHASMEGVRRAARVARCDEFIERLGNGYHTIIGERGVRLSSGQRQRVAIARAVLADPRILILDEATASLDNDNDARVQHALRQLRRGRTAFVIAHRLSTIRSADQILMLEHGRIVERGTHADLYRLGGRYRSLHDRQYWAADDDAGGGPPAATLVHSAAIFPPQREGPG